MTFGHGCFPNCSPIFSFPKQSSWCTATEGLVALAEDTGQHLKGFGSPDWWTGSLAGDWIVYSMDRKGPLLFLPILCCLNPNWKGFSSTHAALAFYGCLLHTLNSFWLVRPLHWCQTKFDLELQQRRVQLLQSWRTMVATMMWHCQGEDRHTDLVQTSNP